MPHLIIHYSRELENDIDLSTCLEALSNMLGNIESIRRTDIKARAIAATASIVGESGSGLRTFNVQLFVMPGRPAPLLATVADKLLEESRRIVPGPVEITVEIRDLEPERYRKVRIG
jgi:5-carboxymethyl-2-hydroxymuconate isomerase